MGASQERKKRRLAKEAEVTVVKQAEPKKKKGISVAAVAIIVVVVFALIAGVATYFTSDYFYQNTTAVRIGDTEYSIADFNYYYWRSYQNYYDYVMENYEDTYANYLPNENIPYDEQYFSDELTWDEYFESNAIDMLQELTFLYNRSVEEGYELSAEGQDTVTSDIVNSEYYALNNGYGNIDAYLAAGFGNGMDLETYRMNLERYTQAYEYAENKAQEFVFSEEDCAEYYEVMADTYDVFEYRYYEFPIDTAEGIDESTARDNAYYAADDFMKAVESEQDFIDLALENASEEQKSTYENENATLVSAMAGNMDASQEVLDWILDDARKEGDMGIVEVEDESKYVLLYFINRNDNSYNLVNARHILVQPEDVYLNDYEDDEAGYDAAVAAANAAAKAEAEDILQQWLDEGGTEDQFAALADELSDDTAEGGLYEDIYQGMMIAGFDEWIFEEGRKSGDYEIVESDYGYHIIYFVGEGPTYANYIAQNDLGAAQYEEWYEENYAEETLAKNWAFRFAK